MCHGHTWEAWHTPVARGIPHLCALKRGRCDVHLGTILCQTIVSRLLDNEQETPVQNWFYIMGVPWLSRSHQEGYLLAIFDLWN